MVEIEIGVRKAQRVDRRVADRETLVRETAAWEAKRNAASTRIQSVFTNERAHQKLRRAYRSLANAREATKKLTIQLTPSGLRGAQETLGTDLRDSAQRLTVFDGECRLPNDFLLGYGRVAYLRCCHA